VVRIAPGSDGLRGTAAYPLCFGAKDPLWRAGEGGRRQGFVDPGRRRQRRRNWHAAGEALGVRIAGGA